ncbi:MAG: glutamate--tRNA ligase family protein, partial [Actinomycetota bacterium]
HHYPGTCRGLTAAERRAREADGRRPAWRLRVDGPPPPFVDLLKGEVAADIDDFVVARNDGTPAYHLVTVVDDDAMDVDLVVRGDDLLDSTGRQLLVARLLGLGQSDHAHVPLVLGADGQRLAKRHGAVTLPDLAAVGTAPSDVLRLLATSLRLPGAAEAERPADLLDGFDPALLPTGPWTPELVL